MTFFGVANPDDRATRLLGLCSMAELLRERDWTGRRVVELQGASILDYEEVADTRETLRGREVEEHAPSFVLVENSPALTGRGLGTVLGDLAALGYDCKWTCLSAAECGAPHKRDRIWIVATDNVGDSLRGGQPD